MSLIFALLAGCAPDCATLSADDCGAARACAPIEGRVMTFGADCYTVGDEEPVGCQEAEVSCPPAVMYAGPGDGTCFEIATGCLPEGWERCPADDVDLGECPA